MEFEKFNSLLELNSFFKGKDLDRLSSTNVVVFDKNDKYLIDPKNTHGLISHTILHLNEFEPDFVTKEIDLARRIIQQQSEVYILGSDNKIIASNDKAKTDSVLTKGTILNTFDLINDDIECGRVINSSKDELLVIIKDLTKKYDSLIDEYKKQAIDADLNIDAAKEAWSRGRIIKFRAQFLNQSNKMFERFYYINPKNSGLLATDERGIISTFFRIDKVGNNLQKIRDYFSHNISIKNKNVRELFGVSSIF